MQFELPFRRRQLVCLSVGVFLGGLSAAGKAGPSQSPGTTATADAGVQELRSPAATSSGLPRLVRGQNDKIYLCWIEAGQEGGYALRFSEYQGESFSAPTTIAEGSSWFVNWADFPSLAVAADGTMAAHWLQKLGDDTYAYGVRIRCSEDQGKTWGQPFWLHQDQTPAEHGFASLVPLDGGRFVGLWLDGRDMPQGGTMALRSVEFEADGTRGKEVVLDPRVCECCTTAAVAIEGEVLGFYRDRTETEIRDVSLVRGKEDRWLAPTELHDDGWQISG